MDLKSTVAKASELIKARRFDEAIPFLKDLIKTNPDNELALGMLASIYAEIQMQDKAIALYEHILSINPDNSLACFQLGLILFNSQQFDKAIKIWEPALADAKNFMVHYFSGLAYLQQKQPAQAKKLLEKAQQHMPTDHHLKNNLNDLLVDRTLLN